ncbi:MAG: hypothetical protein IPJ79_11360 [Bacteroidetes bacterium]|nr:hypothetical protein [Bacteroidota bacterium]
MKAAFGLRLTFGLAAAFFFGAAFFLGAAFFGAAFFLLPLLFCFVVYCAAKANKNYFRLISLSEEFINTFRGEITAFSSENILKINVVIFHR